MKDIKLLGQPKFINILELKTYLKQNKKIDNNKLINRKYLSRFSFSVYHAFDLKYLRIDRTGFFLNNEPLSEEFINKYPFLVNPNYSKDFSKFLLNSRNIISFINISCNYLDHKRNERNSALKIKTVDKAQGVSAYLKSCNKHEPRFIEVLFDFFHRIGTLEHRIIFIDFIIKNISIYFFEFNQVKYSNLLLENKIIVENLLDKENEAVKIDSIDLSESKGIDKIRYLIELGVLDFLKTKAIVHSNNALASAVSGITGVKQTTAQPYINAYFTDTVKNNPLSNTKEMDKIKHTLNKLGYIKDE